MAHLAWLPIGAAVGFSTAFLFGDLLTLPVDLYYLLYFATVLGFLALYVRLTGLDLRRFVARRLKWSLVLGVLGGLILMQGVLARPETPGLSGFELWWGLLWKGLVYGTVDGLLLFAFPWAVVWRALDAEGGRLTTKLTASALAFAAILLMTTTYHLGYRDFRSSRLVQPNMGSAIASVPTLLTANPVASPISHVFLHVTAVLHAPETELFLPPHR